MFLAEIFNMICTDPSGDMNITKFTYKELSRVTENFSPSNKIGEGGFGSVYKGKLRNGKLVAVKVLSLESRQGAKEFLNELMAISNVSHENLVKLYGYCVEGNQRILVYNYLENNSLAQTLLGMVT
jgi:serine/threonine protein kinase